MHLSIVPASPRTAQAAIRHLLAAAGGPTVRGVYRDLAKVPAEFRENPRFEAVKGDIDAPEGIDLSGTDAVFLVQPPVYQDIDTIEHARVVAEGLKAAVKRAGSVKRVVVLSSQGAQYDQGVGEILTNHVAEKALRDATEEVVFVRCAYFMENWAAALETIPAGFFFTTITPVEFALPHIASKDIGEVVAQELLKAGEGLEKSPYIFELEGPAYSSLDVHKAWEEALGEKIEMKVIPKEGLAEFYGNVFPPGLAQRYAELNQCFMEGGILYENPNPTGETRKAKTELVEVFKGLLGTA
ncbi:hypothetical protein OQA88_10746 [Cercophora sp. LCS_1]